MRVGRAGDTLVTHVLGSCLGLAVYDPVVRVGGLLHAMLPQSAINPEKAQANPSMFVDTGVPSLLDAVYRLGGNGERLLVKAAGCARPLGSGEMFKIGERNCTILRLVLWRAEILLDAEDIGGTASRTVHLDLATGRVRVTAGERERDL